MSRLLIAIALWLSLSPGPAVARTAGTRGGPELVIADKGSARAVVVVAADAGEWEKKAAGDLVKYIGMMSGAAPRVVHALPPTGAAIVVGKAAVAADPRVAASLSRAAKKDPLVRADAISVRRDGQRLYLAGSNDESHYFAASWLLQAWGCRWYMPTDFGEVIPEHRRLSVGALDFAYAPPFEIRRYWVGWNSDATGAEEFQRRNFMSSTTMPGYGHALGELTGDIAPPGGSHFNVPFADPRTAANVAARIEREYADGKIISLAISDGQYANDHPADRALGGDWDPYMLTPSHTDAMMTLYNNVAAILKAKHPKSRALLGGMAYSNATLPPRRVTHAADNLAMWIAPIDIDPNHAMDDPRFPARREYREMVARWSKLMNGRLAIYDYDQSMLVWRDMPNPSHHVFARDARTYRDLGVIGIQTESRGALSATFLNLFFRGQLMWNPDADVSARLREFYPGFYGPAAAAMERYWSLIFDAWTGTQVTEHEYLAIPAIYTPALVDALRVELVAAEAVLRASGGRGRNADLYAERMRFTRVTFDVIDTYVATVTAAAREADYTAAVAAGAKADAARLALRAANPLFTSGFIGGEDEQAAWLPGELRQYAALAALSDGTRGTLVRRLPLEWSFKIESPLPPAWRYAGGEGPAAGGEAALALEAGGAAGWRPVRTDVYLQGQGVLAADRQSHLGTYWYRTKIGVDPPTASGKLRLMFPGLFNEAWLYVNGKLVAHRPYKEPWWRTDYRFEWDVDVSAHLRAGENDIALRGFNPHHFAGMFRRPFLYRPN